MSGIWLRTSVHLLLDKHTEAFPQPEDCRRTSEPCKWMEYNYWFSPLLLACVQACMFCRMPGGKQRQTQQYCKGQPDYSFQTPETLRIIGETTTKHFTDCLFPKICFYEHGQDRSQQQLPVLYIEPPTPPFFHSSSHSKATCLFEYRIELYWQLALVLIPPPKTMHSCQRDMQMHRASEMPLQHFHSMPLGWDVPFLQRGLLIDSRYLWEANTWWWADDAYIEMALQCIILW